MAAGRGLGGRRRFVFAVAGLVLLIALAIAVGRSGSGYADFLEKYGPKKMGASANGDELTEHVILQTSNLGQLIADLGKMGWRDESPSIETGFLEFRSPDSDLDIVLDPLSWYSGNPLRTYRAGQLDVYLRHKMGGVERIAWTIREWMHL